MIPTSNHNSLIALCKSQVLYIFWFLHQTTTPVCTKMIEQKLYIFWFLHQTTTSKTQHSPFPRCISFDSYIKPQPGFSSGTWASRCISFDSYIKPQPQCLKGFSDAVVYLLIPTSNHNPFSEHSNKHTVVYLLIPTSSHNLNALCVPYIGLYIFWFLHQTTTLGIPRQTTC